MGHGSERPVAEAARREVPRRVAGRRRKKRRSPLVELAEFVAILLVALGLVFVVVRPYVAMSYFTPTRSMVPTIQPESDRVLVNKLGYRFFAGPERGDIVVLEGVEQKPGERPLLKRVVGLEGDEIQVQGGRLLLNGEPQSEPYLNPKIPDASSYGPVTVPEDHVFVMGDNRARSRDSRVFGPVPAENLEGEVFLRFWPLSRAGGLQG